MASRVWIDEYWARFCAGDGSPKLMCYRIGSHSAAPALADFLPQNRAVRNSSNASRDRRQLANYLGAASHPREAKTLADKRTYPLI